MLKDLAEFVAASVVALAVTVLVVLVSSEVKRLWKRGHKNPEEEGGAN